MVEPPPPLPLPVPFLAPLHTALPATNSGLGLGDEDAVDDDEIIGMVVADDDIL